MFYQNYMLHIPDSPRQQNAETWLSGKTIRTKNKQIEMTSDFTSFDLTKLEPQIAHGFIKVKYEPNYNRLTFLFKHGKGIYKQFGFRKGHVDVPLPDIYLVGYMKFERTSQGYRIWAEDVRIGSIHIDNLPLSNVFIRDNNYTEFGIKYTDNKRIYYTEMCHGGVLDEMMSNHKTITESLNALSAGITSYLMSHGNYDLRLPRTTHHSSYSADSIGDILRHRSGDDTNSYKQYWVYMNLLSQKYDIDELYNRLSKLNSRDEVWDLLELEPEQYRAQLKATKVYN